MKVRLDKPAPRAPKSRAERGLLSRPFLRTPDAAAAPDWSEQEARRRAWRGELIGEGADTRRADRSLPVTDAQRRYIALLARRAGVRAHEVGTRLQASTEIERLKSL